MTKKGDFDSYQICSSDRAIASNVRYRFNSQTQYRRVTEKPILLLPLLFLYPSSIIQ